MPSGLELKRVQRGSGRVHLTPALRPGAPVRTLCGRELPPVSVREVDAAADCSLCRRRQNDPAAVSSAFFADDAGERVLELSLEQARARARVRPERRAESPPKRAPTASRPAPKPASRQAPQRRGELDLRGLREFSDNVYLAPGGAIVRVSGERVAEVVGEAGFQLRRQGDRLVLRAGDLVVEARITNLEARAEES